MIICINAYGPYEEDVHDDDTVVVPDILVIHVLLSTFVLFTVSHRFVDRRHDPVRKKIYFLTMSCWKL